MGKFTRFNQKQLGMQNAALICTCEASRQETLNVWTLETLIFKRRIQHFYSRYHQSESNYILFFTPFVAEAPHHILLYVVGCCTKGAVELTYKWCHVSIYLFYVAMSCTRGGQSHPGCRSAHFCCRHTGHGPGLVPQVEFGEPVYGMHTRGETTRVP